MRIPRIALPVVLLVLCASSAFAHGGNFKLPGGGGNPRSPFPGIPVPGMPGAPTVTRPSGRRTNFQPLDWQMWWQLNAEALLPERGSWSGSDVVTPSSSVFQMGRAAIGTDAPVWDRKAERGATELAMPYLLSLLQRRNGASAEMVSTALIAVGRIAREDPPLALIQSWAVDRKAMLEVREAAVLALGLLRRSERARQLSPEKLSRIRDFLLTIFDDKKSPTRVRAFAIYSISLLADQPYPDCTLGQEGCLVTRSLWMRLKKKYPSQELTIALLTALGHQPPRGVPSSICASLRDIARGRIVFRRSWDAMERSHALTTVARLDADSIHEFLLETLRGARECDAVQTAALIALSQRAESMTTDERVTAAKALRRRITGDRHWLVRGLAHVAMGTLLGADLRDSSHGVLTKTDVSAFLEREARHGSSNTRPHSVLGLGLSAHRVPNWSRPAAQYVRRVRQTCAWGLKWGRGSDRVVGAYAAAAGLARAEEARALLSEILRNKNREQTLRGHCALALGLFGRCTDDVVELLLAATRERVSPYVHLQAVRALALLGAEGTREELLKQLDGRRSSRPALVAVASALGRLQDPQSVTMLLDLARDPKASSGVRVASVMALGLTFDPEARPSRTRLTTHANFPAMTWSLAQVYNIM